MDGLPGMPWALPWPFDRTYMQLALLAGIVVGATAPLIGVLLAMRRWYPVHRLIPLAAEILLAMLVYGAGLWWAVHTRRVYEVGNLASPELLEAETTEMAESLTEQV
jgi:hypothetical protein